MRQVRIRHKVGHDRCYLFTYHNVVLSESLLAETFDCTQFSVDNIVDWSLEEKAVTKNVDHNAKESIATNATRNEDNAHKRLSVLTVDLDAGKNIMAQMSPSALSPRNFLKPRGTRINELRDAANQFIDAWMQHPRLHDRALGYLYNGLNCITGGDTNLTESSLQELATEFATTFGSNDTQLRHGTIPRPAVVPGSGTGGGQIERLKSSIEKRSSTAIMRTKRSGTGKVPTCSFCGNSGHNRSNCPTCKSLGREYTKSFNTVLLMLTLPMKSIALVEYNKRDQPLAIPDIPHETCRIVIHNGLVPKGKPKTTNPNEAFLNISLYDGKLKRCDEAMSTVYKTSTVVDWINRYIDSKKSTHVTKKFGVHINSEDNSIKPTAKTPHTTKRNPKRKGSHVFGICESPMNDNGTKLTYTPLQLTTTPRKKRARKSRDAPAGPFQPPDFDTTVYDLNDDIDGDGHSL